LSKNLPLLFSIFLAVISIGIAGYAVSQVSQVADHDHADLRAIVASGFNWNDDAGFWNYVNDNYASEGELSAVEDVIESHYSFNQEQLGQITAEVVKNKVNIKGYHPLAANLDEEEQSVSGTTPGLTFSVDKSTFVLGEAITVSGTGEPGKPVFFSIVKVNTTGTAATTVSDTGSYVHDIPTEFDDPEGTWKLWASQGREQSKTITVEVSN